MDLELSICEEHASDAAFLWSQRSHAVNDAQYDRADLAALDERLEAHLDGLRFAGPLGVQCSAAALGDEPGPGEAFVATLVAVEQGDVKAIARVLDLSAENPTEARGIVSALGWVHAAHFNALLPGFLSERCGPVLHRLGIGACAIRRQVPPGSTLERALASPDTRLRARALRAVGELGRGDLAWEAQTSLDDDNEECRFWAAWSGVLLGNSRAPDVLWGIATGGGIHAERAAGMAARRLDPRRVTVEIPLLAKAEDGILAALAGAAGLGDASLVPWLIEQMEEPAIARRAGLSLSMITGVDLGSKELEGRAPAGFSAGPSDDPEDDDVAMDPDDGLPFADLVALRAWWAREKGRFEPGTRYLLGKPVTDVQWLEDVIARGHQLARASAAVEMVLARKQAVLPEVRAAGCL